MTPGGAPAGGATGGLRHASVEAATSLLCIAMGAAAVQDSLRIGAGWAADGPKSGTFPFWVGLVLILASAANLVQVARARAGGDDGGSFLTWAQLRLVLSVLVPTAVYVFAIPATGIYLASAVLVAWFMNRLGRFGLLRAMGAGLATAAAAFVIFEIWFLVALPKGPIEDALGF